MKKNLRKRIKILKCSLTLNLNIKIFKMKMELWVLKANNSRLKLLKSRPFLLTKSDVNHNFKIYKPPILSFLLICLQLTQPCQPLEKKMHNLHHNYKMPLEAYLPAKPTHSKCKIIWRYHVKMKFLNWKMLLIS